MSDYDDDEAEATELAFDCHLTLDDNDGLFWCGKAGSEECDFECPYAHLIGTNGEDH